MSWSDFEKESSSGSWVKLNVGMSAELVVLELVEFFTKEWDDGKTDRMVRFRVIDASDPEAGQKDLEVAVRRAHPLHELRVQLKQNGIDLASRLIKITCYADTTTKPGRTIGRWKCEDLGPAPLALLGNNRNDNSIPF